MQSALDECASFRLSRVDSAPSSEESFTDSIQNEEESAVRRLGLIELRDGESGGSASCSKHSILELQSAAQDEYPSPPSSYGTSPLACDYSASTSAVRCKGKAREELSECGVTLSLENIADMDASILEDGSSTQVDTSIQATTSAQQGSAPSFEDPLSILSPSEVLGTISELPLRPGLSPLVRPGSSGMSSATSSRSSSFYTPITRSFSSITPSTASSTTRSTNISSALSLTRPEFLDKLMRKKRSVGGSVDSQGRGRSATLSGGSSIVASPSSSSLSINPKKAKGRLRSLSAPLLRASSPLSSPNSPYLSVYHTPVVSSLNMSAVATPETPSKPLVNHFQLLPREIQLLIFSLLPALWERELELDQAAGRERARGIENERFVGVAGAWRDLIRMRRVHLLFGKIIVSS